jgi:hypothetical protein
VPRHKSIWQAQLVELRPIYLRIEKIISIQVKIDQAYIERHLKGIKTSSFTLYAHVWLHKSAGTFKKNKACPGTKTISGALSMRGYL